MNMYIQYLKQAWNLLRQERLFSLVYMIGTGLSVSMVMVLSIVFFIKIADIYPETNRGRMLVMWAGKVKLEAEQRSPSWRISEQVVSTCLSSLKGVEAVGLTYSGGGANYILTEDRLEQFRITTRFVNTGFWKVFSFRFLQGQPFTEADQQSGIQTAVISESFARRLFGTTDAVGKFVTANYRQYRVCGVVKDVPQVADNTFSSMWIPYTASDAYKTEVPVERTGSLGRFASYLLVAPGTSLSEVKAEVQANVRRYSQTLQDAEFTVMGQPDSYWQSLFRTYSSEPPEYVKSFLIYGGVFLILLLVPAVNLSGMTDSRMERRLAEMGVRRAFGAPVGTLMRQIVVENFLFTLLGGGIGLAFSYLLLHLSRKWIMQMDSFSVSQFPEGAEGIFDFSMLVNYRVFGITLLICLLLNLLSALIPAWRASHRQIVYSLNVK